MSKCCNNNCNSNCDNSSANTNSGIFLKTLNQPGGSIPNYGAVIFDTIFVDSHSKISYNSSTGIITFKKPGLYTVDWLINIGGSGGIDCIAFNFILFDGTVPAQSISPVIVPSQIAGIGLIEVTTVPTIAKLINVTGETLQYTTDPIQACLRIYK